MRIRWTSAQPQILDWAANGEVVQALPTVARQTERAVQYFIEIAANAGAANTSSLGSQIEGLADHSSFPEQFPVGCCTTLPQDWFESRQQCSGGRRASAQNHADRPDLVDTTVS